MTRQTFAKTIAFRVDGSMEIGTGHYMRCLVIARALRKKNIRSVFVSKQHDTLLGSIITDEGFDLVTIPKTTEAKGAYTYQHWAAGDSYLDGEACAQMNISTWFVDHYGLDFQWAVAMKSGNPKATIVVLDDMQDRALDGDILLDPNLRTPEQEQAWNTLAPAMRLFRGPDYLPMSQTFGQKNIGRELSETINSILINYSGIDNLNATQTTLEALLDVDPSLSITVLASPKTPYIPTWEPLLAKFSTGTIAYGLNPEQMADLYLRQDLAFGAGGVASWERCVTYLPTAMAWVADNQINQYTALKDRQAIYPIGHPENPLFAGQIKEAYENLKPRKKREDVALNARTVCDGKGLNRILSILLSA